MAGGGSDSEDLLRQFEAALSGMGLDDLHKLALDVTQRVWREPLAPHRPRLRRPRRSGAAVYRIRVDLVGARPPIWRRLDIRSDLTLDVVHRILQAAFGWFDYHLYRFALGGDPFDPGSELFLCPFDVEEQEDDGVPASEVRLDETLQDPGDVLAYVYDYGDSWNLRIRLEEVLPLDENAPSAACVDGRRAAPPEDCGGLTDADELAEVLDDPTHFDVAEVNLALNDPYFLLRDGGVPPRLVELIYRLGHTEIGDDLATRLFSLMAPAPAPTRDEKAAALRAYLWFLDQAQGEGMELTAAGYLKPADVEAACQVLPTMRGWIGKNNREANAYPLLEFREMLQHLGLLRKYKGRLRLTRVGAKVAGDPDAVYNYLARKLVEERGDQFSDQAGLLVVAYAATTTDGSLSLDTVAEALGHLGWVDADRLPVGRTHLTHLKASPVDVLSNVGDSSGDWFRYDQIDPAAVALAREALRRGGS